MCCALFRTELVIAVKSALQLVVKGREKYSNLNDHLCSMIELFLILREKCFVAAAGDDANDEITSLIHKEWHLNPFIEELIQALLPKKSFGGSRKQFSKEIMVRSNSCNTVMSALPDMYPRYVCTMPRGMQLVTAFCKSG